MSGELKKVIFLDRDGVINFDKGYVGHEDNFEFVPDIFDVLKGLRCDFEFIVITNQSGIARGFYTQDDFHKVTQFMLDGFLKHEIEIKKVYFCPHGPQDGCKCRKPKTGMIEQACQDFDIDLENSWFVGDKITDMQCAFNAHIPNRIWITEDENLISDVSCVRVKEITEITKVINLV